MHHGWKFSGWNHSRLTIMKIAAKGLSSLVSYLSRQAQYEMAEITITFVANGFSTFLGLPDLLQVPRSLSEKHLHRTIISFQN
jgi:hypothetical protein